MVSPAMIVCVSPSVTDFNVIPLSHRPNIPAKLGIVPGGPIGSFAAVTALEPSASPWHAMFGGSPKLGGLYGQPSKFVGPAETGYQSPITRADPAGFPGGGLVPPPSCFSSVGKRPLGKALLFFPGAVSL